MLPPDHDDQVGRGRDEAASVRAHREHHFPDGQGITYEEARQEFVDASRAALER